MCSAKKPDPPKPVPAAPAPAEPGAERLNPAPIRRRRRENPDVLSQLTIPLSESKVGA